MEYNRSVVGEIRGKKVERFVLKNPDGIEVSLLSYGANLSSVRMPDKEGSVGEITLGFDSLDEYLGSHPYFGATIGRYANRIGRGEFSLEGRDYVLAKNNGPNHLHGGITGFDKQVWDSAFREEENGTGVRFSFFSPHGQEGYPGNLRVTASYLLTNDNELILSYEAETDQTTIINLTNHTYWNLEGPGKSIHRHIFQSPADRYLPVDEGSIPLGPQESVTGTPFDFSEPKPLGKDLSSLPIGYDHCLILPTGSGEALSPLGIMEAPESGRRLDFYTDQPGFQLYTAGKLQKMKVRSGIAIEKFGAFCVETQKFPDTPHHPEYPSAILRAGEKYVHYTRIKMSWG
jgi:aldose 1-epimerase